MLLHTVRLVPREAFLQLPTRQREVLTRGELVRNRLTQLILLGISSLATIFLFGNSAVFASPLVPYETVGSPFGGFSPTAAVYDALDPDIAIDGADTGYLVYAAEATSGLAGPGPLIRIKLASRSDGDWKYETVASFTPPSYTTSSFSYTTDPHVAVNAAGDVAVTWIQSDSSGIAQIYLSSRSHDSESFTTPTAASNSANVVGSPRIGVTGTDKVYVAWREDSAGDEIYYSSGTIGSTTLSSRTALSGAGLTLPTTVELATNETGDFVIGWVQSDAIRTSYFSTASGSRTPAFVSGASETVKDDAFDLAFNDAGRAVVAWTAEDGSGNDIPRYSYRESSASSSTWSTPTNLSTSGLSATATSGGVDATGNMNLAWIESRSPSDFRIVAKEFSGGGATSWSDSSVQTLSAGGGALQKPSINLAVNDAGDSILTWDTNLAAASTVFVSDRKLGGEYSACSAIEMTAAYASAIDSSGSALFANQLYDPATPSFPQESLNCGASFTGLYASLLASPDIDSQTSVGATAYDVGAPTISSIVGSSSLTTSETAAFVVSATDAWSDQTEVTWTFDDGSSETGDGATHSFASPGNYTITATATDSVGNRSSATLPVTVSDIAPTGGGDESTSLETSAAPSADAPGDSSTGQDTPGAGDAAPVLPATTDTTTPVGTSTEALTVSGFKLSPKTVRRSRKSRARFSYSVSAKAKASIKITRICKKKSCGKSAVVGTVTKSSASGKNKVTLPTRLHGKRIKSGSYRATIIATDSKGRQSKARSLRFRVKR